MKSLFLLLLLSIVTSAFTQKPEKVHSIVKELRTAEWYEQQSGLWEEETKKNPKNGEAWYYYYSANRALKNICWEDQDKTKKYFEKCNEIAAASYKAIPNSFEANHLVWWNGYNDPSKFSNLEKAYNINPLDERTYRDMMTHYALKLNENKVREFAIKIFKVNEMPAASYNWAYNLLAEAEPNAIIFTAGDNDTYLPWIVQQALGFRKDVTVMNTSLILVDDYREKLFTRINIPQFTEKTDEAKSQSEYQAIKNKLFKHIFKQKNAHPVYVSATAMDQFRDSFESNLYLVGLNYQYCENNFYNLAVIKRNYENRYLIDYISESFSFHSLSKKSDDFNVYYLQGFIKLHTHYINSEEFSKANVLKEKILIIAKKGGQETNLKAWINDNK